MGMTLALLVACSGPEAPGEPVVPTDSVTDQQGDLSELDALGDSDVDRGLPVDIVSPAEFSEGVTQESLDNDLADNGFRSATLNDDGTVTYTMTKAKHDEMLTELRDSIQESANEFIADEPDTYTGIALGRDLRNFTV
jgi:hypothetical protein